MIKVVYIAAHNRSGSTLLDRMLGQLDGYVSVGELRQIWVRGLAGNQACGCGLPFHECAFWVEVLRDAYGPLDAAHIQHVIHLARHVASARTLPSAHPTSPAERFVFEGVRGVCGYAQAVVRSYP